MRSATLLSMVKCLKHLRKNGGPRRYRPAMMSLVARVARPLSQFRLLTYEKIKLTGIDW